MRAACSTPRRAPRDGAHRVRLGVTCPGAEQHVIVAATEPPELGMGGRTARLQLPCVVTARLRRMQSKLFRSGKPLGDPAIEQVRCRRIVSGGGDAIGFRPGVASPLHRPRPRPSAALLGRGAQPHPRRDRQHDQDRETEDDPLHVGDLRQPGEEPADERGEPVQEAVEERRSHRTLVGGLPDDCRDRILNRARGPGLPLALHPTGQSRQMASAIISMSYPSLRTRAS